MSGIVAAGLQGLSGIGDLFAALGAKSSIKAAGRIAELEGEVNARLLEAQAADIRRVGETEARRAAAGALRATGVQRTAAAGQGVDVTAGGTVADIQAGTEALGALDAMTIRNNARRAAVGLEVDAIGERFAGRQARQRSKAQALQTLITGGISVARGISGAGASLAGMGGLGGLGGGGGRPQAQSPAPAGASPAAWKPRHY